MLSKTTQRRHRVIYWQVVSFLVVLFHRKKWERSMHVHWLSLNREHWESPPPSKQTRDQHNRSGKRSNKKVLSFLSSLLFLLFPLFCVHVIHLTECEEAHAKPITRVQEIDGSILNVNKRNTNIFSFYPWVTGLVRYKKKTPFPSLQYRKPSSNHLWFFLPIYTPRPSIHPSIHPPVSTR